jgi:hypothetical protein
VDAWLEGSLELAPLEALVCEASAWAAIRLDSRSGESWLDGVAAVADEAVLEPVELADPPGTSCPAPNSDARPLKGWVLISDCI